MNNYETGETCSTHGKVEKHVTKFRPQNVEGRSNAGDIGTDGRVIIKTKGPGRGAD
jgi:hypothetical protein